MSETLTNRQTSALFDLQAFATRDHGTRLRYMSGCRCTPCRAANSRYSCARDAARRAGDWNGWVSAEPARAHLLRLRRLGVGARAVQAASDVARSVLVGIAAGRRLRCRKVTARRILAVDVGALADAARVDARPTWKLIRELLEEGFTKAELARRFGYRSPALQFGRRRVLAATAVKVERFYRLVME